MDIDHLIKILALLISFLQGLIWPSLALFALLFLGKTLKTYVENLGKDKNVTEVSAEAGPSGVRLSIKREVELATNVATNLALAVKTDRPDESQTEQQASYEVKMQEAINVASRAATLQTIQKVVGAKILWVDDKPENNTFSRSALEALGIHFTRSTSTKDALEKLRLNNYDVIISDMVRNPDMHAGYTLLEAIHKQGINTPFIIYARSNNPMRKAETMRKGGTGDTSNPQELFQLVINAIQLGK